MSDRTAEADRHAARFEAALAALRRDLTEGRFDALDMLPSERQLADELSVSRTTLRRVLGKLVDEQVLSQRQGVGTFVNRRPDSRPRAARPALSEFAEEWRLQGRRHSMREIDRASARATGEEALMLGQPLDAEVVRVCRLHYADDAPTALERIVVSARLFEPDAAFGPSLVTALTHRGYAPARIAERIAAEHLGEQDALLLDVAKGAAALVIARAFYGRDERCHALSRSLCRGDRYEIAADRLPTS